MIEEDSEWFYYSPQKDVCVGPFLTLKISYLNYKPEEEYFGRCIFFENDSSPLTIDEVEEKLKLKLKPLIDWTQQGF